MNFFEEINIYNVKNRTCVDKNNLCLLLLFLVEGGVEVVVVVVGGNVVSHAQHALVRLLRGEVGQLPAVRGRSTVGRVAQVVGACALGLAALGLVQQAQALGSLHVRRVVWHGPRVLLAIRLARRLALELRGLLQVVVERRPRAAVVRTVLGVVPARPVLLHLSAARRVVLDTERLGDDVGARVGQLVAELETVGENGHVLPHARMPVRIVVALLGALVAVAIAVRVLARVDGAAVAFGVLLQILVGGEEAGVAIAQVARVVRLPALLEHAIELDVAGLARFFDGERLGVCCHGCVLLSLSVEAVAQPVEVVGCVGGQRLTHVLNDEVAVDLVGRVGRRWVDAAAVL